MIITLYPNDDIGRIRPVGTRKEADIKITFEAADTYVTGGIDLTGVFVATIGINFAHQIRFSKPSINSKSTSPAQAAVQVTAEFEPLAQKLLLRTHADGNGEYANGAHFDGALPYLLGTIIGI